MNNVLHNLEPMLNRLARFAKIALFLLLFGLLMGSMFLSLNGVIDADKRLVESLGPSLMFAAVTAAVAEIAGRMVRVHLEQTGSRQTKR